MSYNKVLENIQAIKYVINKNYCDRNENNSNY